MLLRGLNSAPEQLTTKIEPVFLLRLNTQDHQVIGGHLSEILSLLPIVGDIDAIAFMGKARCQGTIEAMVIFYHQNTHGKASSYRAHQACTSSTVPTIFCSSGSIMAYPDDKSMTKMGRNVHVPVMETGYTLAMTIV